METFLHLFFQKLDTDTTRILFLVIVVVFLYLAFLVVIYITVLFFVAVRNAKLAQKNGIVVLHKFQYSWMAGVALEPIIIEKEKRALEVNTNPIKNAENKDSVTK